jgi:hypothetical protein
MEDPGSVLHRVLASVVDALPIRLWQPANLFVGGRLHFCAGSPGHPGAPASVRTVEWNGREIAHGHELFHDDESDR